MHIQQISIRLAFLALGISIWLPGAVHANPAEPIEPTKSERKLTKIGTSTFQQDLIKSIEAQPRSNYFYLTNPPVPVNPPIRVKPGETLSITTKSDDLNPTDDLKIAREQAKAYPDNPEAHFILAVALTRTSNVEEAIQEVRRAKKLAYAQGGSEYFDKTIAKYESMLTYLPEDDKVRYGLAWAYYMKAYLIAQQSKDMQKAIALKAQQEGKSPAANTSLIDKATQDPNSMRVKGALELAHPDYVPYIRKYYELSLGKLDELISRQPGDTWAKVYRAFVKAEYTGNVEEAMNTWLACRAEAPNNPSPYFFLAEGYLKQGNLKESLSNISKAVALRAQGY